MKTDGDTPGGRALPHRQTRRGLPFLAVTLVGLISAALPPGPENVPAYLGAAALALLACGAAVASAWLPRAAAVVPPVAYVIAVAFLALAEGGINSGTGALVLVPIVWVALYGDAVGAGVVVAAAGLMQLAVSVVSAGPFDVDARRFLLWTFLGAMVVIAIRSVRAGLAGAVAESNERQRQSEVLSGAARDLTSAHTVTDVLGTAVRCATAMASADGDRFRAAYYRIDDGMAEVLAESDPAGSRMGEAFRLAEHPFFSEIVRTRQARSGRFGGMSLGPAVRRFTEAAGLTAGMGVPVALGGAVHGILAVATRGRIFPAELFERFTALGQMVELALGEVMVRDQLARQATTDQLTGLDNRRGLSEAIERRGRHVFSVISLDLDNLKAVNDSRGHLAGDAVIMATAHALRGALRSGEVVARVGGDEFVVFLAGSGRAAAVAAADRLLAAVRTVVAGGIAPSVSIGVAAGRATSDPQRVLQRADTAMYQAKRLGGMRVVVA